jgi:hypothetical protein
MKITLQDGVELDTNKLCDKEAAITEAIHNLYDVCKQYNVTAFLRVILNPEKYIGMTTVIKDDAKIQDDFDLLMASIGKFVDETSGGKIALMIQKDPSDSPEESI